ncbi:MAG: hypothetical protein JKY55_17235 [Aliivibrio sp.]|uniref:hypothetical protein n=1 Tax=Aliivibrio sp. TaxID=1872443 RepID=UPI001A588EAC|nr:hypothetical protein [Aliivibrio sp.]
MTKRDERIKEGRHARLRAEVRFACEGTPIVYRCIYLVFHQANQYKLGWDSVNEVDINTAIGRATGAIPSKHSPLHQLHKLAKNPHKQRGKSLCR